MVSLLVLVPAEPSAIDTVPELMVWLAEVLLVNVANVPSPASAAAVPLSARAIFPR